MHCIIHVQLYKLIEINENHLKGDLFQYMFVDFLLYLIVFVNIIKIYCLKLVLI